MTDTPSLTLELTKLILDFLSENFFFIVMLIVVLLFKKPLSNLIPRIISLSFKKGDSNLNVGVSPQPSIQTKTNSIHDADAKPIHIEKEPRTEKDDKSELHLLFRIREALEEQRCEDAETIFREYALDEKSHVELAKNKAMYLFLKFDMANDNSAIDQLYSLANTAETKDSKSTVLNCLAICLNRGMEHEKEVDLWRSFLDEADSEELKTATIISLASALNSDSKPAQAKFILVERLAVAKDDTQKSKLYKALSRAEEKLGNKSQSIYCKDKSLQFDANNREELFDVAYSASDEGFDEISIGNYAKLVRIDAKNSTALNNLAVRAQEAGLKIKAVENYKVSSKLENSLAMANQGYLLLDAGFTDEAEKLAEDALKLAETHQNVHKLITAIQERKSEQSKEWEQLQDKALSRQRLVREYTEQFYTGHSYLIEGNWLVNGIHPIKLAIEDNSINTFWLELGGFLQKVPYRIDLIGRVTGSTFEGTYTKFTDNDLKLSLAGAGNVTQRVIGYMAEDGARINLIGAEFKDDFTLYLTRNKD
jgi:hypothetical protein